MFKQELSALKLMVVSNAEQDGCVNQNMISLIEEIERLSKEVKSFNQLPFELCQQVATLNILRDVDIINFSISDKEFVEGLLELTKKYSFEKLNKFPGSIASFNRSISNIIKCSLEILFKKDFSFNSKTEDDIVEAVVSEVYIGGYDEIVDYVYSEEEQGNIVDFKEIFPENKSDSSKARIIVKADDYLNRKSVELESFKEDLLSFCKKLCS